MSAGFRIRRSWPRVSGDLVARGRTLPVANVSDAMHRLTGTAALQRFHRAGPMAGPAFTVRVRPGDNLLLHKALDMAAPGDVIVVDAGGALDNALIGELMVSHAKMRGIAGVVIDGALRDRDELYQINLPIFARGVCHRGPYKDGPGEIGFPVSIDGMTVAPGDLVLGDGDGVLAVPREGAAGILDAAEAKQQAEEQQVETTLAGNLDRSWVDRALEDAGCVYVD